MKIIEAMKKIKDLMRKAEDVRRKISTNSAKLSIEDSPYDNPKAKLKEWLQMHSDVMKEILRLRIGIQKTNLDTMVEIDISGNMVTKSIAEWIHRRRDLATLERSAWNQLTNKNLKSQRINSGSEVDTEINVELHYSQEEKDNKVEELQGEPSAIDSKLEVVNCITDIIE